MKLLIVDDSELIRKGLKKTLMDLGFQDIIEAKDGMEGFKKVIAENVELVFLDVEMPKMDGAQVLSAIRANDTTHDLPVIIVTSHAEKEKIISFAKAGVSGYLVKPFTKETVQAKLKETGFLKD